MALRQFLLRLQLWVAYDNTSSLKKRHMFLAGLAVWSLPYLVIILVVYDICL